MDISFITLTTKAEPQGPFLVQPKYIVSLEEEKEKKEFKYTTVETINSHTGYRVTETIEQIMQLIKDLK